MTRAISRRALLGGTAAAAGLWVAGRPLLAIGGQAAPTTCTGSVPDDNISIQLYTCTPTMAADAQFCLDQLAGMGYRIVEHAGFGSAGTAENFRTALDNAGIRCTSGHQGIAHPFDEAAFRATCEDALIVGQRWIVTPGKDGGEETVEDWTAYCETMNQAGEIAVEMGLMGVGHHNHQTELEAFPENPELRPIDVYMAGTNPDTVHWELDLGWAWATPSAPADLFAQFPGRFRQFHVKDMAGVAGQDGAPVYPGQGLIGPSGFAEYFAAAKAAGQPISEYIIEQDGAPSGLEAAQLGWMMLSDMTYEYECTLRPWRPGADSDGETEGDGSGNPWQPPGS